MSSANPSSMQPQPSNTDIQNQVAQIQKILATVEVEGTAGAGEYNVKISLNGRHEAIRVIIDPQLLTQPVQVLSDLVAAAITDASHKVETIIQDKMMDFLKSNPK